MKVVVLGLWHLGCVTTACCAEHFDVVGLDFDEELIASLRSGHAPIFEPGLDELIGRGLASGKLSFTSDPEPALDGADVVWVCYDTPVDDNDEADVSFVMRQIEQCLVHARSGLIVLVSSQVPVGTCGRLRNKYENKNLFIAYSPENLRLGQALRIFRSPDRVVIGIAGAAAKSTLANLVAPFASDRVLWMGLESAEMTKHAINSFLALSVTFANEIARLCETVGADASEVERGLRSESRIGPKAYIRPGSAFSGGTLARDVVTLTHIAQDNGEPAELLSAILASNERHKNWAIRRLGLIYDTLKGIDVAVLGLTYKPGTDTLRRSSAVATCAELLAHGAKVRCYDPVVSSLPPQLCAARLYDNIREAVQDVNVVIVATEWPEIELADWKSLLPTMKQPPVILDANAFLKLASEEALGMRYFAVGRSVA